MDPPPDTTGNMGGTSSTGSPTTDMGGSGTGGGTAGTGVTQPPNMGNGDQVSFDTDVHPILVEMCGLCHSMEESGLPLHGAADVEASFAAVQGMSSGEPVYQRILARAAGNGGYMPPGYAGCEELGTTGCLSQEEYDTIALWVEQGAMNR